MRLFLDMFDILLQAMIYFIIISLIIYYYYLSIMKLYSLDVVLCIIPSTTPLTSSSV